MSSKRHEKLLDPHETFSALCTTVGLDVRLRKAVSRLGYVRPTLVQSKSLPLAITSGKDLLVRARTGSGKTLAYCLPVLHKILESKRSEDERAEDGLERKVCNEGEGIGEEQGHVRAVILVPTRELCTQVHKTLVSLTYYCREVVTVAVLSSGGSGGGGSGKKGDVAAAQQEAMLRDRPDVIVSTPAGLLHHLQSGTLKKLKHSVESLVVDEADLILSFGYSSDVTEIMKSLPKIFQGYLMSATLSPEIHSLKRVILHSPAVLKLEEDDEVMGNSKGKENALTQFYLTLPKVDKRLVLYVFLKLGLLKGKGLFFVNTTDGGYRLKLFFEQFHIRSAVLNAELPLRSRLNIIEQFNIGNFDYLIATDESTDVSSASNNTEKDGSEDIEKKNYQKKRKRGTKKDSEYGVSRGLDFRGVSFVVNVDLPPNAKSYTHRVGRTARGGASGVALSLVEAESPDQLEALKMIQESQQPIPYGSIGVGGGGPSSGELQTASAEELADEGSSNKTSSAEFSHPLGYQPQPCPLDFDLNEIEGFRYRVEDVSRAVTKVAVRETRAAELRAEILNSDRLSSHFEENPSDLHLLQHDRQATHVSKIQDHLKNIPKHMLPRGMQVVESRKRRKRRVKKHHDIGASRNDNDPLKSYEGGDVTLDGVAGGDGSNDIDPGTADAEFFDYGGGESTGGIENDSAKPKRGLEKKVFMNTTDDTGKSTSGRNAWKEKRSRGKFSRKYKKMQRDKF